MADSYVVTGAYVTVKTVTPDGVRIVGRYAGAPVPPDASPEWITHHLDKGLIAKAPEGTPPAPPSAGTVEEQGAPDLTGDQPRAEEKPARAAPVQRAAARTAAKD